MLREELTEEYEADKQAALTQLSQQKELELMAAREGWQRKVEDLLEQVGFTEFCLDEEEKISSAHTNGDRVLARCGSENIQQILHLYIFCMYGIHFILLSNFLILPFIR